MPVHLRDIVKFSSERLFNGAVNIDWYASGDGRTTEAARAFVFHGPEYHGVTQAEVGVEHGHRLQDTANFVRSMVRQCYGLDDVPFTLAIAGYGTGKSHLGLTLAVLLNDPKCDTSQNILKSIEGIDAGIGSEIRATLKEAGQPCLVVPLNGMRSFDLTTEITQQIIRSLRASGLDSRPLDELRPRFAQAASLIQMANEDVRSELVRACAVSRIDTILTSLERQDELVYVKVHDVFSAKGMPISALRGESIRDIIDVTVREYCGRDKPYRSLLLLFDEFGRYTEFATIRSQIAGSGVLQDLFEGIQDNAGFTSFVGFIQFELNSYVQRVASEYKNEILRYVTRYQTAKRVYLSINLETLIANLFEKQNPKTLDQWFDKPGVSQESKDLIKSLNAWFPQSRNHTLWCDPVQFHKVIRKGCWPLSPYSTWLLFHLAAAGKHLQERSALALLGETFDRFEEQLVPHVGAWSISPADLWSDTLQQELLNSEEGGQQGSITHAYTSVVARHGAQLTDELRRLLRAVVMASKLGLVAADKNDAIKALSELAGVEVSAAQKGIQLLLEEVNVLEWDEKFKAFDILSDAIPRTQFLLFLRSVVASTYDEIGKASLFASKVSEWCDLLGDLDCDFAEEHKITTREWRYKGITTTLDLLLMQVKMASDRWRAALGVDDPRGTIIYCYVEPSRNPDVVARDVAKALRGAAQQAGVEAIPIIVILLCDEDGTLGQAMAELAVLSEKINDSDRARFGNLIAAHVEKNRQVVRTNIENMIKRRLLVAGGRDDMQGQRLGRVGTELFEQVYEHPVTFPFDGFSTSRGNAADSCQELTSELLLGKLDYDAVMGKPVKVKNRAVTVLRDSWGIFAKDGSVRTRPTNPVVKSLTEKWDDLLATKEARLPMDQAIRQICMPPFGANIASAGLLLGVFMAPRLARLLVVHNGQQKAPSVWIQDGLFRGKFIDINALRGVDLFLMSGSSSEWEVLLDEWDQAESFSAQSECLERAAVLTSNVPVPAALAYRYTHLKERAVAAVKALREMNEARDDEMDKVERAYDLQDVSALSSSASKLKKMSAKMTVEKPSWTDHQIEEIKPSLERAKQAIIQFFPGWLTKIEPRDPTPEAIGDFKHKMLRVIGSDLRYLTLDNLAEELEVRTNQLIRKAETIAEARQLIRDVRSWLTSHGDAARLVRVAEIRALREVGNTYTTQLQVMSNRIKMTDIGEVRTALAEALANMKAAEDAVVERAALLWNCTLQSEGDIEKYLDEVNALVTAFENCPKDLEDLHLMQRTLRMYDKSFRQLSDELLTWTEFDSLAQREIVGAGAELSNEEVPWPPAETLNVLFQKIRQDRENASADWIKSIESESAHVQSATAAEVNRLHVRANTPPAVLTAKHAERLATLMLSIESRLDTLKLEVLVEKFRELSPQLRKRFLATIKQLQADS